MKKRLEQAAASGVFAKLKAAATGAIGGASQPPPPPPPPPRPFDSNPIVQSFDIGELTATVGPGLLWKVYDAKRKCDDVEVSVFVFEKKDAEKFHKPRRKESVTELLRRGFRQLENFCHPKILKVIHSLEECDETLAFGTEAVYGSLSNILEWEEYRHLDDEEKAALQKIPIQKDFDFSSFEIKYGLLQITEALAYVHDVANFVHRNVCPASIIITKKGTWKLTGFEFVEKFSEDGFEPIRVTPWTSKIPKMLQPDLDFIAPETQNYSYCNVLSDMFSFGLFICSLFNEGRTVLRSLYSVSSYHKQMDNLEEILESILPSLPLPLQEAASRLSSIDPTQRPTAQLLSLIKFFSEPSISALQYLDVITMKDPIQKAEFYKTVLMDCLPFIPRKLWFDHVWPSLQPELKAQEALAAALMPTLFMIRECTQEEYNQKILPFFRTMFTVPRSVAATVTLLENLHVVLEKTTAEDIQKEVLPILFYAMDTSPIQIQTATLMAIENVHKFIDDATMRRVIVPKTKTILEKNLTDTRVNVHILQSFEKYIRRLEKCTIVDDIIPMMLVMRLDDPDVLMRVVRLYKILLEDQKYGVSVHLLATKIMPSLFPQTINLDLTWPEYESLHEGLLIMLQAIHTHQRGVLKNERRKSFFDRHREPVRTPRSTENIPFLIPNLRYNRRKTSTAPPAPPAPPQVQAEQQPPQPPRLSVASAVGAVKGWWNAIAPSSPDSNFLRVQNTLPNRRLSDNQLTMPPKIRVAPSCASSPGGSPAHGLPIRRHSSIGPQERRSSTMTLTAPTGVGSRNIRPIRENTLTVPTAAGGSMPNTAAGQRSSSTMYPFTCGPLSDSTSPQYPFTGRRSGSTGNQYPFTCPRSGSGNQYPFTCPRSGSTERQYPFTCPKSDSSSQYLFPFGSRSGSLNEQYPFPAGSRSGSIGAQYSPPMSRKASAEYSSGQFPGPPSRKPSAASTSGQFPGPPSRKPSATSTSGQFPGPPTVSYMPSTASTSGQFPGPPRKTSTGEKFQYFPSMLRKASAGDKLQPLPSMLRKASAPSTGEKLQPPVCVLRKASAPSTGEKLFPPPSMSPKPSTSAGDKFQPPPSMSPKPSTSTGEKLQPPLSMQRKASAPSAAEKFQPPPSMSPKHSTSTAEKLQPPPSMQRKASAPSAAEKFQPPPSMSPKHSTSTGEKLQPPLSMQRKASAPSAAEKFQPPPSMSPKPSTSSAGEKLQPPLSMQRKASAPSAAEKFQPPPSMPTKPSTSIGEKFSSSFSMLRKASAPFTGEKYQPPPSMSPKPSTSSAGEKLQPPLSMSRKSSAPSTSGQYPPATSVTRMPSTASSSGQYPPSPSFARMPSTAPSGGQYPPSPSFARMPSTATSGGQFTPPASMSPIRSRRPSTAMPPGPSTPQPRRSSVLTPPSSQSRRTSTSAPTPPSARRLSAQPPTHSPSRRVTPVPLPSLAAQPANAGQSSSASNLFQQLSSTVAKQLSRVSASSLLQRQPGPGDPPRTPPSGRF